MQTRILSAGSRHVNCGDAFRTCRRAEAMFRARRAMSRPARSRRASVSQHAPGCFRQNLPRLHGAAARVRRQRDVHAAGRSIARARGCVANEAYLDLQGSVDAAWKSLNDFAPSLGRNLRLDPNLALAFRMTRKHLDDAVAAIDRYLEKEPASSRRPDFEAKRRQIAALKAAGRRAGGRAGRGRGGQRSARRGPSSRATSRRSPTA